MPTLSQLNQDATYLINLINQCEGDDGLTSLLENELDTKFKEISEKIDAYIYVSRMLESEAEFLSTESKRMKELAEQKHKVSKRLKNTVMNTMSGCGVKKQSTNYYSITIASNSVPTIELGDIEDFPEEFLFTETIVKIDKDKVKNSIDDNGLLYNSDGKIIAKVYKGKHLRVR